MTKGAQQFVNEANGAILTFAKQAPTTIEMPALKSMRAVLVAAVDAVAEEGVSAAFRTEVRAWHRCLLLIDRVIGRRERRGGLASLLKRRKVRNA